MGFTIVFVELVNPEPLGRVELRWNSNAYVSPRIESAA